VIGIDYGLIARTKRRRCARLDPPWHPDFHECRTTREIREEARRSARHPFRDLGAKRANGCSKASPMGELEKILAGAGTAVARFFRWLETRLQ